MTTKGNIVRDALIALTVAFIAIAAIVWVPTHNGMLKNTASTSEGFSNVFAKHSNKHTGYSRSAHVSYNNPGVRATLDIPWERRSYRDR